MSATVDADGDVFAGVILGNGCGTFHLERT